MLGRIKGVGPALAALLAAALLGVAGSAAAQESERGYALVQLKDPVRQTVTLRGQEYQVEHHTALTNEDGARITLADLRAAGRINGIAEGDASAVFFEARELRGQKVLDSLRIVAALPR